MPTEIENKLSQALTVAELIGHLKEMPRDARVVFACDYGDRHHTTQALLVCEVVDLADEAMGVESSGYSQSGLAIKDNDDQDDEDDADGTGVTEGVVILR